MLVNPKSLTDDLSPEEQKRLDDLLSAARNFHYTSFLLAGLSLAISSLDTIQGVNVPIWDVTLPNLQAIVGIYLLVIAFSIASDRLFMMAQPWLNLDSRRPQFSWIALNTNKTSRASVSLWLMFPLLLCALATANALATLNKNDITGFTLAFVGVIVIFLPRVVGNYWILIQEKRDHRGGSATFSIYLLYWFRIIRQILGTFFFFTPVLAVIPTWRDVMLQIGGYYIGVFFAFEGIRIVTGFRLVYKLIDKLGKRFGFPAESQHYK